MDGASSLRMLRWKQICAGALSAASLIAGHLVFGQEAQPTRRYADSAAGQSTPNGSEPLAPILNARAKPAPAARPGVASKSTGNALPPILEGKQLPKPRPSEATFVPLQPRQGQTVANPQPVATLELAPNKDLAPVEKPSAVSPWMMDIDQALAEAGKSKSIDKPADKKVAEAKSDTSKQAGEKENVPPIVAAANSAPAGTKSKVAPPPAQLAAPTVQFGHPMPAPKRGTTSKPDQSATVVRSPAELRNPAVSSPPAAQLNPFAPQNSTFMPKSDPVAAKAPEAPKYSEYVPPAIDAEAQKAATEAVAARAEQARVATSPTKSSFGLTEAGPTQLPGLSQAESHQSTAVQSARKAEPAAPQAWFPPVDGPDKAADASKPTHADVAEAPIVERTAVTQRQNLSAVGRGDQMTAGHRPSNSNPLQLTGYEPEERATFGGKGNNLAGDHFEAAEPRSESDLSEREFQPTPSPSQPQFTQTQAPRPLPGMPAGPFEMIGESGTVSVMVRRSMLLRTAQDIYRTAVVDPNICDVVQFTPKEISIIGKSQGSTHVTFWFDGPNAQPITYLVKVEPDSAEVKKEEDKYKLLEDVVNEMFPDSKVQLMLVADKLIVKGQAKDSEEATQIMSIIRTNAGGGGAGGAWGPGGWNGGAGGGLSEGVAADVLSDSATGSAARARYQVINMLRVPGVQQVALRVKIAELNRTAARGFGVDVQGNVAFSDSPEGTDLFFNSILNVAGGGAPALLAQFDGDDISIGIRYLQQQGVIRLLSEPTLVTMSGRPATFVAGGEFAVPTVVGSAGLNAVTTDFRAFGAIISFLPTVVDKDRIRLEVSPEFSQINQAIAVGGTPGLKTRAVTTTVEMREGQTFAIAGLLEDNMNGTTIGDLPFFAQIFGRRSMQRAETELIILVTPELVHPMEAEEVPPLPGFDVTEPDNAQFFLHGKIEGTPTREYRSTVWPRLKNRYKAGGPAMTSGPFGHGQ